jgi:2-oxoglutarate ferredoxin oxidoreductase subunit beta
MVEAVRHRGFGFVDILQPCVTFNKVNTFSWYKERVYDLSSGAHDPTSLEQARRRAREWPGPDEKRIPIGIFYKVERPVYEAGLPALKTGPLTGRRLDKTGVQKLFEEFI